MNIIVSPKIPAWTVCRRCLGTGSEWGGRSHRYPLGPCTECQGSKEVPFGELHRAFFPDTDHVKDLSKAFEFLEHFIDKYEGDPPNFYDPPRCIGCGKYISRKRNWNQCPSCDTREDEGGTDDG
jgi:hypothetical protein